MWFRTRSTDADRLDSLVPLAPLTRIARMSALALAGVVVAAGCETAEPRVGDNAGPDADATHDYQVNELVTGLEHPWALAFLPGGDILITERPGRVRLVRDGALRPEPVQGAPTAQAGGQGGMLDLVVHPDFETNRFVYISYSKSVAGGVTTAVARARWEDDRLQGLEDVFVAQAAGAGGQHFGGRMVFDRDGYLYLTIGDRGTGDRAANLADHAGTTIRLHDDGSVPSGNPFVDRDDVRPEIYTLGNRNAQGMALHPETGEVWQNEHGPRGGDEINRMEAGADYGWPRVNYGTHYDGRPIPDPQPGGDSTLPLLYWVPSIAPSGLAFYTGDRFPNWHGNAFNGALAGRHIRRVVFDGTDVVHQEELLADYGERIRDVRDGPDGYIYFLTDSPDGMLARLEP
jgi:aldose sugar dehydrogenase